jgi:hypothetical protein
VDAVQYGLFAWVDARRQYAGDRYALYRRAGFPAGELRLRVLCLLT